MSETPHRTYPASPSLQGRTAFVAGASGGINLAVARRLARAGASVTLVSRSAERVEAAASSIVDEGGNALDLAGDVRDSVAVEHALQQTSTEFGAIDMVISGAAGSFLAPATKLSANAFKTVVDIDLNGTFNVLRGSWPHLRKPALPEMECS